MRISIVKLLLVFIGLPLAYAGYLEYSKFTVKKIMVGALAQSSVRCSNQARADINPGPASNRADVLAHIETGVQAIEERRVTLQSEISPDNPLLTIALAHMRSCQTLLLALRNKTRAEVVLLASVLAQKRALSNLYSSVLTPFFDAADKSQDRAMDAVKNAEAEYEIAYMDIRTALDDLRKVNAVARKVFPAASLIDDQLIQTLASTHRVPKLSLTYGKPP